MCEKCNGAALVMLGAMVDAVLPIAQAKQDQPATVKTYESLKAHLDLFRREQDRNKGADLVMALHETMATPDLIRCGRAAGGMIHMLTSVQQMCGATLTARAADGDTDAMKALGGPDVAALIDAGIDVQVFAMGVATPPDSHSMN